MIFLTCGKNEHERLRMNTTEENMENSTDYGEEMRIAAEKLRDIASDVLFYFAGIRPERCAEFLESIADSYAAGSSSSSE